MPNRWDSGSSAPTRDGFKGGASDYQRQPGGPNCSFQSYFEGIQSVIIPARDLGVGAAPRVNVPIPLRGATLRITGGPAATYTGVGRFPYIVVHFKPFDISAYRRIIVPDTAAGAGQSELLVPPGFVTQADTATGVITFENEFEQLYYTLFPTTFPGPGNLISDVEIQAYPCLARILYSVL